MKNFPFYRITPHLKGSKGTFDDTFMTSEATDRILKQNVIVQEKIDGINIGVYVDENDKFYLIQKNQILPKSAYSNFQEIITWFQQHQELINKILKGKYALFGEYLIGKSTRKGLHKWVIIDAIEISTNKFISYPVLQSLAKSLKLEVTPIIFQGKLKKLSTVKTLINKSIYYSGLMEGVCIRIENSNHTIEKYKFVRENFEKNDITLSI